jgi:hypothetical protein
MERMQFEEPWMGIQVGKLVFEKGRRGVWEKKKKKKKTSVRSSFVTKVCVQGEGVCVVYLHPGQMALQ